MNTLLNTVKISDSFRVKATSFWAAANSVASTLNRDSVGEVAAVKGDDETFIVVSNIGDTVYRDVLFVENIGEDKYRVEVGDISLSDFDVTWLVGGDEAVNAIGYYKSDCYKESISTTEYEEKVAYWIANDIEEGTIGRMEKHIKSYYSKVVMVNGLFT